MFYSSDQPNVSAREVVEFELVEQYHWLPHEIAKIPYKLLQRMFIIKRQKNTSMQIKQNMNKFRQQHQTTGRGSSRRFYREV